MQRWLARAAGALLLVTAACGSAGAGAPAKGAVTGVVEIQACGGPPPAAPQPVCKLQPVIGARVDLVSASQTVGMATTDVSGHYTIWAAPGTYTVRVLNGPGKSAVEESRTVKVESGQQVEADFHIVFEAV